MYVIGSKASLELMTWACFGKRVLSLGCGCFMYVIGSKASLELMT